MACFPFDVLHCGSIRYASCSVQGGLRPGAYLRERLFGRRSSQSAYQLSKNDTKKGGKQADKKRSSSTSSIHAQMRNRSSSVPPTATPSSDVNGEGDPRVSNKCNTNTGLRSAWTRLSRPGRSLSAEPGASTRQGGEAATAAQGGGDEDNQVPKPRLRKKGNGNYYRNSSKPAWEERVTYYVKQNCNPKWDDQSFVFDLAPEAPEHPRMFWLRVRVLDYDFLAASSFLGQVRGLRRW